MTRDTWVLWGLCFALMGLCTSAIAQETPSRPRFTEGLERVQLGCGRLTARLPAAITNGPMCGADDPVPSRVHGVDRVELSFEPDYIELVVVVEETPLSAADRALRRAEWSTWPSHFVTASPRLRIQRRDLGGLEVRVDDGSIFTIQIDWPDGDSYVDEHQPPARLLAQVERDTMRVQSQLLLTLAPGRAHPMAPGRVSLPIDEDTWEMDVTDGVLVKVLSAEAAAEAEPGCPARFEVLARDESRTGRFEPHFQRGLVGACPDGRIARGRIGSPLDPRIEAALASVRLHDDAASATPPTAATIHSTTTTAPTAPRGPCRFVVDDPAPPLRIRASSSSRSDVVGTLDNGTAIELVERHGRWARIASPVAGWVWTENLREQCP
ncbi:MAG: SH3 domain-containing protein [Sandaracinus sp.]